MPQGDSRLTLPFFQTLVSTLRNLVPHLGLLELHGYFYRQTCLAIPYWRALLARAYGALFYRNKRRDFLYWKWKIDWDRHYLETEKLDATTDIFKSRRAIRILTEIKENFTEIFNEGHILSLKDDINDIQDEMVWEHWDWYKQEILDPNGLWRLSKEMLRSRRLSQDHF